MKTNQNRFLRLKDFSISVIIFVSFWYILHLIINSYLLPSPFQVLEILGKLLFTFEMWVNIGASVKRALIGFILALVIASTLAYIVGFSKGLKKYFRPLLELIRPIPPLAWIPLAILWFGIGDGSAVFIIFIAVFFPIFTNVYFGLESLLPIHKRVSKNYKLNRFQDFIHVVFPFTLPYLFTGAKTGIGFSWMVVIAAEMISASHGLGYFIETSRVLLKIEEVIAAMIIIGLIGYLMHLAIVFSEKKITSWRYH